MELKVGEAVESRHAGQGKWYEGKVAAVDGPLDDPMYEIHYNDGDMEKGRARYQIRRSGDQAAGPDLVVGEAMDARHGRGKKWYVS
jgi:hypothetical protein